MHRNSTDLKSWFWVAVLFVLLAYSPAPAAEELRPADLQSGSLLLRMKNGYSTATLLNTDVDMQISGMVARVSVRQEFENTGSNWVEGVYVFPLPDKAAVDRLRLYIGERFIEGDIQEKLKARETYEKAKSAGKKTSLVEQQRANLFTTSVANIAPGERVVVEIEYLEDVRFENGEFSLRFPMTLTPRYVPGTPLPDRTGSGWSPDTDRVTDASAITPPQVTASNAHRVTLSASVNAGVALELIASRYHPVEIAEVDSHYAVSLLQPDVPMDHDFELLWRPVPASTPRAMAFREDIGERSYAMLMLLPPDQDRLPQAGMARETIFIIDTSGSMHGVSIAQAKRALQLALDGLTPADRFNVVEFNSVTRSLYPHSVEATVANLDAAQKFVAALSANGGTEMRPALRFALASPPSESHLRQVVFITDGSVGYEDEMFSMIEEKLGAARLFTVGIGSAPNSWFMRKAAQAGKGSYTFISALHEVQEKMDRLFRKLQQPQVTDIQVHWPSGVLVDDYPDAIPDLYAGEPVVMKAEIAGPIAPGSVVEIAGNGIDGAWVRTLRLDPEEVSPGAGALWARAKIDDLMDRERRSQDTDELRQSIVDVAIAHHLVSKYTSLVAVDKTPSRPADATLAQEGVANLLPYGQSANALFGFPATSTSGPLLRWSGGLTLLLGLLLLCLWHGKDRQRVHAS